MTTLILGLICIFTSLIFKPDTANAIAVLWAKLCCGVVPLRIRLTGKKNYDPAKPYVVVSNHQSMADIPAVHATLGLNLKWVMKKELSDIPIFGTTCRQLGCISVDRSDHNAALNSLDRAKKTLSKTASVCFFAEGTRSRDGQLLPFKKGAFKFAYDMNLPILPVTIKNSGRILPSDSLTLKPGIVDVVVHHPINPTDHPVEQIDALVESTRRTIAKAL